MISKSKIFDIQASLNFPISDIIPSYSEDSLFIGTFMPKKTFHTLVILVRIVSEMG